MSANRYEITDDGTRVIVRQSCGPCYVFGGSSSPSEEKVAAEVIRQQARDIDWMRAEIDNSDGIARHLVRQPEGIKARAAMLAQADEIQRLRGQLIVAKTARDGAFDENKRLRAELAAMRGAPK